MLTSLIFFASGLALLPADAARVARDLAYVSGGGERQKLDVYAPKDAKDCPIVVWIHGGAWKLGNKMAVQEKPRAFNEAGFVLVSINYRLHPNADYKQQATDVARAIRWVRDHAREHGGDPSRIFLMGHSAGAHLAALTAIDTRYLETAGLKGSDLSGVVLLDGAGYDVPRQIELARLPALKTTYTSVFGQDRKIQNDASPIAHVARGKGIAPFLILHVATRQDSKIQSEALAAKLRDAGVPAKVVPAPGKNHATINREIGAPDDGPTKEIFAFLKERLAKEGRPAPKQDEGKAAMP